jgi:prolyl-tRNA synthetase
MLLRNLIGERFKEKPADATVASHEFLIRGGYIKQVGSGIYTLLPLGKRITLKIENIIRREMDRIGGQECLFPVMMPRALWDESGRFSSIGQEMFRLKDRKNADLVLGMTHEEAAVDAVRSETDSYKKYPFMIYQIQTKLRDEARPRAGIIRVREFTMKDAYSFHTSQEDLERYYEIQKQAYFKIYKECGLKNVISVRSDSGMMGGKVADEFMSVNSAGEDKLIICPSCGKAYNQEVATCKLDKATSGEEQLKEIKTPNMKTIEEVCSFLNKKPKDLCKAVVFGYGKENAVVVFIRGDRDVNEIKLKNFLKEEIYPCASLKEFGLEEGFVGALNPTSDKRVKVLFDESLRNETNLVTGGNKKDIHIFGFNPKRDIKNIEFYDFNLVVSGDKCECGSLFEEKRGVEIGNIFQLGTKYTQSMGMTYLDESGKRQTPIMGCYGIGLGRIMACAVEESHDNYGIIWPKEIAPFAVHITLLAKEKEIKEESDTLYNLLINNGIEVVYDEREGISAGVAFADADLIGAPVRVVFGAKNFANREVEISTRDKSIKKLVKIENIYKEIKLLLN